ncbi:MAG: MmgE/PrpD family protein [Dehalococcoidales bacterium]|nr:MmgE/PrpD family protein [Dehalococcoidales bacterium]
MDKTLDFLSRYAIGLKYGDLPANAVHQVKRRVIDTLGCAVAGFAEEPARIARSYALEVRASPGATLIGTRHRTAPDLAAFANGVAFRCTDFSDTGLAIDPGHPSDNIAPVLAAAEYASAGVKALITGIVLAYEIQGRFGEVGYFGRRGWDHATMVAMSSALGAGKALGLNQEQMANALALAAVANNTLRQIRVGGLSMWKGAAAGNASRNGVFVALLAGRGMTGPAEAFEGKQGFFNVVTGGVLKFPPFGGKGRTFKVEDAKFKYYPCDYEGQCAVGPTIELHRLIEGKVGAIDKLVVHTYEHAVNVTADNRDKWNPKTRETADHSLPYVLAVALSKGNIWLDDFSSERIQDRGIHALMQKIEVYAAEEYTSRYPEANGFRLELTMRSGEKFVKEILYGKGHPKNPMTDKEIEAKFRRLAEPSIGPRRATSILNRLWHLEEIEDVRQIARLFVLPS